MIVVFCKTMCYKGVYGLVTARSADKKERSFYQEFILLRGDENGKN